LLRGGITDIKIGITFKEKKDYSSMINTKAQITPIGFIIAFFVIIVFGIIVIGFTADRAEEVGVTTNTTSHNETVLTNTTQTLSQTPTTYSAQSYNDTYLDFDGTDDLNVSLGSDTINSTSLWFKNDTTDWTNIINSSNNIYVNGALDGAWTFFPYTIINNSFIQFGYGYVISLDQIELFNYQLNTTQITEVYSNGK